MSRTRKGSKGPGYDYGSRRAGNESLCNSPAKDVKSRTHRIERRRAIRETRSAAQTLEADRREEEITAMLDAELSEFDAGMAGYYCLCLHFEREDREQGDKSGDNTSRTRSSTG